MRVRSRTRPEPLVVQGFGPLTRQNDRSFVSRPPVRSLFRGLWPPIECHRCGSFWNATGRSLRPGNRGAAPVAWRTGCRRSSLGHLCRPTEELRCAAPGEGKTEWSSQLTRLATGRHEGNHASRPRSAGKVGQSAGCRVTAARPRARCNPLVRSRAQRVCLIPRNTSEYAHSIETCAASAQRLCQTPDLARGQTHPTGPDHGPATGQRLCQTPCLATE